jgi:hypothetical protein
VPGLGLSIIEPDRSRSRVILGEVCLGSGVKGRGRSRTEPVRACLGGGGIGLVGAVRVMMGEACRGGGAGLEVDGVEGEPQGSGVFGRPRLSTEVVEGEGETADLVGGVLASAGE